ncbi:MAG: metallophosphoesterase family protein [Thermomicrobiales bacterium]
MALETVVNSAGDVDAVWNLGDIVGYGPRPGECIDCIVGLDPAASLIGNDWAAIGRLQLDEFNPVARFATYWTTAQLRTEHMHYLESLPNRVMEEHWMLVHASPRHPIWEYVYTAKIAHENFDLFDSQVCFLGHTHVQLFITEAMAAAGDPPAQPHDGLVISVAEERHIVNPGSVGQPRDNNPDAAFAIYDTEAERSPFVESPTMLSHPAADGSGRPSPSAHYTTCTGGLNFIRIC